MQDKVLVHVGPSGPGMNRLPAVIGSKVTVGTSPTHRLPATAMVLAWPQMLNPLYLAARRPRCCLALMHGAR